MAAPWLSAVMSIDPPYARNITVYHVNEVNYSASPRNMNTADVDGDLYFDLRSRGLPLECGPWRNRSFWSRLDCVNDEVAVDPSRLAVTKLVLEVDTRWGVYADCNIDPTTGAYSCSCEDVPSNCTQLTPSVARDNGAKCNMSNGCMAHAGRCEPYGCPNETSIVDCTQGYRTCLWNASAPVHCALPPGPTPVCDRTKVGFLNLSLQDWGRHSHPGETLTRIDYWHGNTLAKMQGSWYSTWADGECGGGGDGDDCGWRLVREVKKIHKECSDGKIEAALIAGDATAPWGARCFGALSPADRANKTSVGWIECFYLNVLGKKGGSSGLINHTSPNQGIPLDELHAAWDGAFAPTEHGGCPAVAASAVPYTERAALLQ